VIFKRQPKDPDTRARAALAVLRQQIQENYERNIGLMNMPKHKRAKADLVNIGPDAVPLLIQVMTAPRAPRDTPEGDLEYDLAGDIAGMLGEIGDPRAVQPLLDQFSSTSSARSGRSRSSPLASMRS
jgi:HEAT repeat protein